MSTAGRILGLVLFCVLALAYLYQHDRSVRLTRQLATLATERQLLEDELDSLNVEIAQLTRFERLDSIWALVRTEPVHPVLAAEVSEQNDSTAANNERSVEFARVR
ncbi:MAG: hypothetical protein ABIK86_02290 [candidate division WOR-3 bacterium]